MYCEKRKIRYSHLAPDKSVRFSEILRFVQDAAVMHTSECGYSIDKLYEVNSAWILLSIHLVSVQPVLCSEIIVKTWPYDFSKVFGPRAFLICNAENDAVLIKGSALWTFVDTVSGRPKEIPNDMIEKFGSETLNCDVTYIRRLPVRETMNHFKDFTVLKRDLDSNGHMNNVKYLEYAEEALPDGFLVQGIEVFYKYPLYVGDSFSLFTEKESDASITVNIKRSDGETCTYVRFIPAILEK